MQARGLDRLGVGPRIPTRRMQDGAGNAGRMHVRQGHIERIGLRAVWWHHDAPGAIDGSARR